MEPIQYDTALVNYKKFIFYFSEFIWTCVRLQNCLPGIIIPKIQNSELVISHIRTPQIRTSLGELGSLRYYDSNNT